MNNKRKYWDVGEVKPFYLTKDQCQKFLTALLLCKGKIHDQLSSSVDGGKIYGNQNPNKVDVTYRISLEVGTEELFESIVGKNILSEVEDIKVN